MKRIAGALIAVSMAVTSAPVPAQEMALTELPEVTVVGGRLPGPPLWKVQKGEHVLWVLAVLDVVPNDMMWNTSRVEAVLDEAEAYLPMPNVSFSLPASIMANPVNWARGLRLQRRLTRNRGGKHLPEVLTPDLARRYDALRRRYFPANSAIDRLRPSEAGWRMQALILEKVGLGPPDKVVLKPLERLARRRHVLHRFDTQVTYRLKGSFRSLADRAEALIEEMPLEQELACFQWHLQKVEVELEPMVRRANAWAQGQVDELRHLPQGSTDDPCMDFLAASLERDLLAESERRSQRHWIALVEQSLSTYKSSFAVLAVSQVLSSEGVLAQLKTMGYRVVEPKDP